MLKLVLYHLTKVSKGKINEIDVCPIKIIWVTIKDYIN